MFSFKPLFSATITSTATGGRWSSPSTWVGGVVPTSTDDVVITSGATVNVDISATIHNLDIKGILNLYNGITLTVTGDVIVESSGSFNMPGGSGVATLLVYGNYTNYGTTDFWKSNAVIAGNLSSPSTSGVQANGNIVVGGNISGNFNLTGGTGTNQIYVLNPNATTSITPSSISYSTTISPSDSSVLNTLVNTTIYGGSCGFSINGPSNSSSCSGSSAAFTIVSTTATAPVSFQWEENQGSGWSVLSNGVTYSGVATSTLTITGATSAMNGYNYRCKVTDASSCSKYSFSATLTVTVSPTAIAGGPDNVCQSSSPSALTLNGASVGGSATTGAWSIISGGGTLSSTAQTSSPSTITYTPAANYSGSVTLRLSSNSTNGCPIATADRTITVNPLVTPAITISASNNSICSGVSVNFTALATNGGVSPSYQWKVNGTNVGTNSSSYSYTPNNNDVVTCVLTSNASCTTINQATSNSITMVVNSVPTKPASFISSSASVSQGQTGVAYSISAISNATSYNWSYSGTGVTINGLSSSITLDYSESATSGTLSVYATNSCGASAALTMGITVNPFSVGSIGSDQTICSGNYPSNLTSLSDASPAASTYQWQSSPDASTWTTISGATNNTYSFLSTLTQTTYYRRIATYNSCSGYSNNVKITVNPVPTASFTASGVAAYECLGSPLTLTGSYTPSGGTSVTYNWYKPGNSVAMQSGSSNIFNYSSSLNTSDSGNYGLIVVRDGCTSSQATVTITVRNPPSPQVYRIANR